MPGAGALRLRGGRLHRCGPRALGAGGGGRGRTLFLDEIGNLAPVLQVKLLRLPRERCYEPQGEVASRTAHVRIVAATDRDLKSPVDCGAFRPDLYCRVNVIRMVMPPLRDRPCDVPLLARAILQRLSMTRGKVVDSISREVMRRLMRHDFPGNVRELENILEHAHVLSKGREIGVEDLPEWLQRDAPEAAPGAPASLEELEATFIRDVLARNSWHRAAAARELGIHVTTLHRRVRRLGLELPPHDGRSARRG